MSEILAGLKFDKSRQGNQFGEESLADFIISPVKLK